MWNLFVRLPEMPNKGKALSKAWEFKILLNLLFSDFEKERARICIFACFQIVLIWG